MKKGKEREREREREKKAQPHFRIIVSLCKKRKKKQLHTPSRVHTQIYSVTHSHTNGPPPLNLSGTHPCTLARKTHTNKHKMQVHGHKSEMSSQSRWAPFCVELKASAKPVPLGRGGVHQPAEAPARCPRVARVTLGLLPCHCLDQRGPLLSSRRWQQWG